MLLTSCGLSECGTAEPGADVIRSAAGHGHLVEPNGVADAVGAQHTVDQLTNAWVQHLDVVFATALEAPECGLSRCRGHGGAH